MAGCEAVHAILVLPTCIPYVAASYKLKGSEGQVKGQAGEFAAGRNRFNDARQVERSQERPPVGL